MGAGLYGAAGGVRPERPPRLWVFAWPVASWSRTSNKSPNLPETLSTLNHCVDKNRAKIRDQALLAVHYVDLPT